MCNVQLCQFSHIAAIVSVIFVETIAGTAYVVKAEP